MTSMIILDMKILASRYDVWFAKEYISTIASPISNEPEWLQRDAVRATLNSRRHDEKTHLRRRSSGECIDRHDRAGPWADQTRFHPCLARQAGALAGWFSGWL